VAYGVANINSVVAGLTASEYADDGFAKGDVALTEDYAANGVAPTPIQTLYALHQMLMQFVITGTSITVKKLDNATTAFIATTDSATVPTKAERL